MMCGTLVVAPFFIENPWLLTLYGANCIGGSILVWRQRHQIARRQPGSLRGAQRTLKPSREGIAARSLATMRWGEVFSILWRSGVPVSQALEVAANSARNAHYRNVLLRAADRTRAGYPLSECLAETRLLPRHLVDIVKTGEMTGDLDASLEKFADLMEGDAKALGAQHFTIKKL